MVVKVVVVMEEAYGNGRPWLAVSRTEMCGERTLQKVEVKAVVRTRQEDRQTDR